jgi:hypothetical protein
MKSKPNLSLKKFRPNPPLVTSIDFSSFSEVSDAASQADVISFTVPAVALQFVTQIHTAFFRVVKVFWHSSSFPVVAVLPFL